MTCKVPENAVSRLPKLTSPVAESTETSVVGVSIEAAIPSPSIVATPLLSRSSSRRAALLKVKVGVPKSGHLEMSQSPLFVFLAILSEL